MLRLYKPILHDITKLHTMLKHLVCEVWCKADEDSCESKLNTNFKDIYSTYNTVKDKINTIYEECKKLSPQERQKIKEAFNTNNRIEELCEGTLRPVYLTDLPYLVELKIKPLLVNFYEELLDKARVPRDKARVLSETKRRQ